VVVLESAFVFTVCVDVVLQLMTLGIVGPGTSGIAGEAKEGDAINAGAAAPTRLGMLGQGCVGAGPDGPTAMQFCHLGLPGG